MEAWEEVCVEVRMLKCGSGCEDVEMCVEESSELWVEMCIEKCGCRSMDVDVW